MFTFCFSAVQVATELHENNVEIYVIAVTRDDVVSSQISRISSAPHVEGSTYWILSSYDFATSSLNHILLQICNARIESRNQSDSLDNDLGNGTTLNSNSSKCTCTCICMPDVYLYVRVMLVPAHLSRLFDRFFVCWKSGSSCHS